MTTSQGPRPGRHARLDEPGGGAPPEPSSAALPEPRSAPWSGPQVPQRPTDGAGRPIGVGEFVAQTRESGPSEPGFGEWPYGPRRSDPEPEEDAGPDPYLPCEDAAPEVKLAPGGLPGTLALLAGLVGSGLALFPIIAVAVWPLTIIGIVLGVVGLRRIRAGKARNPVVAVSGVVLSTLGLVLCVSWLSMYALAGVGTAGGSGVDETAVPSAVR